MIEPLVGSMSFVVRLTAQGFRAVMVDDLGNPMHPYGDEFGGASGAGATASEAVIDLLRAYPFTFSTQTEAVNVVVPHRSYYRTADVPEVPE